MIKVDRVDVPGEGKFENVWLLSDDELMSFKEDCDWLSCLEQAGVDNWGGFDFARELYQEQFGEE